MSRALRHYETGTYKSVRVHKRASSPEADFWTARANPSFRIARPGTMHLPC